MRGRARATRSRMMGIPQCALHHRIGRAIVAGIARAPRPMSQTSPPASPSAAPAPPRRRPARRLGERASGLLVPLLAVVIALAVWAAVVKVFAIPDYLLPAPQAVGARILKEWPTLWKHGAYTLLSVLTGFLASIAIGVPIPLPLLLP